MVTERRGVRKRRSKDGGNSGATRTTEVIAERPDEHPAETLTKARSRARKRGSGDPGPQRPRMNCEDERSPHRPRTRPLDEELIDDICRMAREGMHRCVSERLLGLGTGRIAYYVKRGKPEREAFEKWESEYLDLRDEGKSERQALRLVGKPPQLSLYAQLDIQLLADEASSERSVVAALYNRAIGHTIEDPKTGNEKWVEGDTRALTFLLSRRHPKRWGSRVEATMVDEADIVTGDDKAQKSAVVELAERFEAMFARKPAAHEEP